MSFTSVRARQDARPSFLVDRSNDVALQCYRLSQGARPSLWGASMSFTSVRARQGARPSFWWVARVLPSSERWWIAWVLLPSDWIAWNLPLWEHWRITWVFSSKIYTSVNPRQSMTNKCTSLPVIVHVLYMCIDNRFPCFMQWLRSWHQCDICGQVFLFVNPRLSYIFVKLPYIFALWRQVKCVAFFVLWPRLKCVSSAYLGSQFDTRTCSSSPTRLSLAQDAYITIPRLQSYTYIRRTPCFFPSNNLSFEQHVLSTVDICKVLNSIRFQHSIVILWMQHSTRLHPPMAFRRLRFVAHFPIWHLRFVAHFWHKQHIETQRSPDQYILISHVHSCNIDTTFTPTSIEPTTLTLNFHVFPRPHTYIEQHAFLTVNIPVYFSSSTLTSNNMFYIHTVVSQLSRSVTTIAQLLATLLVWSFHEESLAPSATYLYTHVHMDMYT